MVAKGGCVSATKRESEIVMSKEIQSITTAVKTSRNNVEPERLLVTMMVVIFLCGLIAIGTLQGSSTRHFPGGDDVGYCLTRFESQLAFLGLPDLFAFLSATIASNGGSVYLFAFLGLLILPLVRKHTDLTPGRVPVSSVGISVKLRQQLDRLAFPAAFRYDCITHCRLLISLLCLEPFGSTIPPFGSFYVNTFPSDFNTKGGK
ncbi:hypothetical protein LCGC14_0376510 [marine sediment metagenome]|uniref:Uncharacterized protein n=1 Tax=marine sediment metagenome TaxID=412755 RepID=A0A0F9T3F4_9ZZZZ